MGSEFVGIVSKRDKLRALNINQLKLEVHDTYKKDENITIKLKPVNDEDVISNAHPSRLKLIKKKRSLILIRERLQRI